MFYIFFLSRHTHTHARARARVCVYKLKRLGFILKLTETANNNLIK